MALVVHLFLCVTVLLFLCCPSRREFKLAMRKADAPGLRLATYRSSSMPQLNVNPKSFRVGFDYLYRSGFRVYDAFFMERLVFTHTTGIVYCRGSCSMPTHPERLQLQLHATSQSPL